jgi:hypothetical protein
MAPSAPEKSCVGDRCGKWRIREGDGATVQQSQIDSLVPVIAGYPGLTTAGAAASMGLHDFGRSLK